MARRDRRSKRRELNVDKLQIIVGPAHADAEMLEAMRTWYEQHGDALERDLAARRPGFRPWAFWFFRLGRHPPDDREECHRVLTEGGHLGALEAEAIQAARAPREAS